MKKFIAGAVITTAALFSGCYDDDSGLEHNMESLADNYAVFEKSNTQDDALNALNTMRSAAVDSKKYLPHSLENKASDDLAVQGYQAGLDQLVVEIDKVTALVKQDKLDQAKVEAQTLLKIRDENHKKYYK